MCAKLIRKRTTSFKSGNYSTWLKEIKIKVRNTQIKTAVQVNAELIELYWELGQQIEEKQARTNWGEGFIEQVSKDLMSAFPEIKGFSLTNLKYIRQWYKFYTSERSLQLIEQLTKKYKLGKIFSPEETNVKSPQPVGQIGNNQKSPQAVGQIESRRNTLKILQLIPWGHNREIVARAGEINEAVFYIAGTIRNNWPRNVLVYHMEYDLFRRQGKAITNFKFTLPKIQSDLAIETLKNPYILDFLSLGSQNRERTIESGILNNLKRFLLELGKGFAYVGNQYNLKVKGDDFFLDLLFFNFHLQCFVVFELKFGEFKPEYAGKLNFYINAVDKQIKTGIHHPTIGTLLCKTPNKTIVEYALGGMSNPLGVANYRMSKVLPKKLTGNLPTIEELKTELGKEAENYEHSLKLKKQRSKNNRGTGEKIPIKKKRRRR